MILRAGMSGIDVVRVQRTLISQGFLPAGSDDGKFGFRTWSAVKAYQAARHLLVDGIVGPQTQKSLANELYVGEASQKNIETSTAGKDNATHSGTQDIDTSPPFPPMDAATRAEVFGDFDYMDLPGGDIKILGAWEERNIIDVYIPQLDGVPWYNLGGKPCDGHMRMHRLAAKQFQDFFALIEERGLLHCLVCVDGAFCARHIRGRGGLSNHSWGTALDLNADFNQMGCAPAQIGYLGSLIEVVPLAHECGLYWGGNFSRRDGMHFEIAKLIT